MKILTKFDVHSITDNFGDLTAPAVLWATEGNGDIFARIAFPPTFVERVTEEGMKNAFAHEMWHLYSNENISSLSDIDEILDHSSMLSDPVYDMWLRAVFPGKSNGYYETIKYAGAENTQEYNNLSQEKKEAIALWRRANKWE